MVYQWINLTPEAKGALTQLSLKVELSEKQRFLLSRGFSSLVQLIKCAQQSSDDHVGSAYARVLQSLDEETKQALNAEGVKLTITQVEKKSEPNIEIALMPSPDQPRKMYRGVEVKQPEPSASSDDSSTKNKEAASSPKKKIIYRGQVKWV